MCDVFAIDALPDIVEPDALEMVMASLDRADCLEAVVFCARAEARGLVVLRMGRD
jgi:hypothetical protein